MAGPLSRVADPRWLLLVFALLPACEGEGTVPLERRDASAAADAGGRADANQATDTGPAADGGSVSDARITDASHDDGGAPVVNCAVRPPIFPDFDRSCTTAADCAIGRRMVDCCGTFTVTGLASGELPAFLAAAAICESQFPGCGCAAQPTYADDQTDETRGGPAVVECIQSVCTTTFLPASQPCGPNLHCNSSQEVCVQQSTGIGFTYGCAPLPPGCTIDRGCDCAGQALCTTPADLCSDQGPNQISCDCPVCA